MIIKFNYFMHKVLSVIFLSAIANAALCQQAQQPVDYVDNFIGVRDKNTSTILGPQLPQGCISPSPQTSPGKTGYDMDCYIVGQPIRGLLDILP